MIQAIRVIIPGEHSPAKRDLIHALYALETLCETEEALYSISVAARRIRAEHRNDKRAAKRMPVLICT